MQDVRVMGRSTQGVRLVNLPEKDVLVGITRIEHVETDGKGGEAVSQPTSEPIVEDLVEKQGEDPTLEE